MIEDNQEFLRNLQSLVFSQTLSELLPDLRTVKLQEEYNFLIYSLWLHSVQVWNDDPGHLSYLLGMLGNYIGDSSLAQAGLESNFSSLSSEDHDYLTTAQSLLYYYLDAGDVVRAKDFALNLYRSSPPEHLEEVKEMVDDSFFTGLQPSRKKY